MRSTTAQDEDLTTRARIRDAAIDLMGRHGFAHVTVRQIATAAGVSAGSVIHHFGSKDGLHAACDAQVRHVFASAIAELEQQGPASAISQLSRVDEYLPAVRYGTRALQDGGPLAGVLFTSLVTHTETWLRHEVAAGHVRRTENERARATLLVCISLGIQLLGDYVVPPEHAADRDAFLVDFLAGAAVELYTHGLFTGTDYLDAMREHLSRPAGTEGSA